MPRRLRIHLPGGFYHATLRGNHRQDVFFEEGDRHLLNTIVKRCLDRFVTRLHASSLMRQVASEFARAMQLKMTTTGHLFERRYHATLVDADSYLLELVRYIHVNPVKANIVPEPGAYPWSSHHAYIGERTESWVCTDFILQMFSPDRGRAIAAYREFVRAESSLDFEPELAKTFDRVGILGSEEFKARVRAGITCLRPRQSLDSLIDEACRRFEVEYESLDSPVRNSYMTKVRAWISHQAVTRGIATMAAVARRLGRDEATLREAIRKFPVEVE